MTINATCNTVIETKAINGHDLVYIDVYGNGEWTEYECTKCNNFVYIYKYTQDEAAAIMLGKVNALRESLGLNPLKMSSSLCSNAQARAKAIVSDFSHNGASYGENIVKGTSSLQQQFNAWLNSPGHYANMTNPDYTVFGYGFYADTNSTNLYGVQTFNFF